MRFVEREGISLLDLAFDVNNRNREETGAIEVDIQVKEVSIELIEQFSAALGDIGISQLIAHHGAILRLQQAIIIGMSGPGFNETNQQLIQQLKNYAINKFRASIGMKTPENERKLS